MSGLPPPKVYHSEYVTCYECQRSLIGILHSHLRLFCHECKETLKLKDEECRAGCTPIVLNIPANLRQ